MKRCPCCQKELSSDRVFCIYCMTELEPKTELVKPRPTGGKRWLLLLLLLPILAVGALLWVLRPQPPAEPVRRFSYPTAETFFSRSVTVLDDLGIEDWDPLQTEMLETSAKGTLYRADLSFSPQGIRFSFPNRKEGIYVSLPECGSAARTDFYLLAEALCSAVFGYYSEGVEAELAASEGWKAEPLPEPGPLLPEKGFFPDGKDSGGWKVKRLKAEADGAVSIVSVYVSEDGDRFSALLFFTPEEL